MGRGLIASSWGRGGVPASWVRVFNSFKLGLAQGLCFFFFFPEISSKLLLLAGVMGIKGDKKEPRPHLWIFGDRGADAASGAAGLTHRRSCPGMSEDREQWGGQGQLCPRCHRRVGVPLVPSLGPISPRERGLTRGDSACDATAPRPPTLGLGQQTQPGWGAALGTKSHRTVSLCTPVPPADPRPSPGAIAGAAPCPRHRPHTPCLCTKASRAAVG